MVASCHHTLFWEFVSTLSFRGRRSRNKVSVGEPAEGSLACRKKLWEVSEEAEVEGERRGDTVRLRWFRRRACLRLPFLPSFLCFFILSFVRELKKRKRNKNSIRLLLFRSSYAIGYVWKLFINWIFTTSSDGYLGSRNDEERSKLRYVMRIAKLSESSRLWTQIALQSYPLEHAPFSITLKKKLLRASFCFLLSNPFCFFMWAHHHTESTNTLAGLFWTW